MSLIVRVTEVVRMINNSAIGQLENNFDDSDDNGDNVLNCMSQLITLNNEDEDKDIYNEYRFGNIKISKQTDFLHFFWLAISLCHEVISISKNKQKLVKDHFDDILLAHEEEEVSRKSSKYLKKSTHDPRAVNTYTMREDEKINDDFNVGRRKKLLKDSDDSDSL